MQKPTLERLTKTTLATITTVLLAACNSSGGEGGAPGGGGSGGGSGGGGGSSGGASTTVRYHLFFEDADPAATERPRLVDPSDPGVPLTITGFESINEEFAPVITGTLNLASGRIDDVAIEKIVYGVGGDVREISLAIGSSPPVPRGLTTLTSPAQSFLVVADFSTSPREYVHVIGMANGFSQTFVDVNGTVSSPVPFPGSAVTPLIDPATGALDGWLAIDSSGSMLVHVDRNLTVSDLIPATSAVEIGRTRAGNVFLHIDSGFICYHASGGVTEINHTPAVTPLFPLENFAVVVGEELFFCSPDSVMSFHVVKGLADGTATAFPTSLMGIPASLLGAETRVVVQNLFLTQEIVSFTLDGLDQTTLELSAGAPAVGVFGYNSAVGDRVAFETLTGVVDVNVDGTGRIVHAGRRLRGFTVANSFPFCGDPKIVELTLLRTLPSGAVALEIATIGDAAPPRRMGELPLGFLEVFSSSLFARTGVATGIADPGGATNADVFVFDRTQENSLSRVTDSPGVIDVAAF